MVGLVGVGVVGSLLWLACLWRRQRLRLLRLLLPPVWGVMGMWTCDASSQHQ